jgi:hypothetical protein
MMSSLDRRAFLRLGGMGLATAAAGSLAACSQPDAIQTAAVRAATIEDLITGTAAAPSRAASSNALIVDTGHGTNRSFLRPLAENGVQTIFRYYAQEDTLPGKNLTPRERDMIFDHGLSIAIVYQHRSYEANRFNPTSGSEDARFCLERAAEIRQPEGTTIFFGVDNDHHSSEDVNAYLGAVQRVFDGRYYVGCYGSGAHCRAAVTAGRADMSWVAEAPAWGGTRDFINSRRWTLFQNKTQIEDSSIMSAGGVPIDTNILNPRYQTIGAFDRSGSRVDYDPATVQLAYDRRMFVTADQLNIRERPNGRVVAHMCVARTVHVLSVSDGWARVDTNEDGRADGYCRTEDLRPLHQMPAYERGCTPLAV